MSEFKEPFASTQNTHLYCLRDKLSNRLSHFSLCESPEMYVREMVAHRVAFPMTFDDYEILDYGKASDVLGSPVNIVPWTLWRFPETKAELLKPLGLTPDEIDETVEASDKLDEKRSRA